MIYGAWCVCSGLWIAACGSTESDVNDDSAGTTPSTESTSNTDATGGTGADTGGASNAANGNGNATTATGSGGVGGSANNTAPSTASATTVGDSMNSGGSTADAGSTDAGGNGGSTDAGGSGNGGSSTDAGGSGNSGGSTDSGGSAGNGGGSTDAGGAAGNGGGSTDAGGAAGNGGGSTDAGGTAGNGGSGTGGAPVDCGGPYTGPIGGKRPDGPAAIDEACAQIDDDVIIARYDNPAAKVPQGLYWEPAGVLSTWGDSCSESLNDTVENAQDLDIGEVEDELASDWSYEVSLCEDSNRRFYSDIRCDYFDGTYLDGGSFEDLAYLASLLWWIERGNLTGAQILGYSGSIGSATDNLTMCTIRTTFGDFGICDRITLEQTQYSIDVDGRVTIGERETVRSIQGDCD